MTLEARKNLVTAEIQETLRWLSEETERINAELDKNQGTERKIDDNREAFTEMHKEFARRMKAIGEKYGLLQNKKDATQMTPGE